MDWLFENLGKLAPVVIFLIYMISSLKGRKQEEEETVDPQAAERARKIQEEIRRKILQRQRGEAEPTGRPPVTFEEPEELRTPARPVVRPVEPKPQLPSFESVPVESPYVDVYEKKRREIDRKLEEAKEMQADTKRKVAAMGNPYKTSRPIRLQGGDVRNALKQGLSSPENLKSSILLSEVLGKPIGMR